MEAGSRNEAERHFKAAVALLHQGDDIYRPYASAALFGMGKLCVFRNDLPGAERWLRHCVETLRRGNSTAQVGEILRSIADVRDILGDEPGARRLRLDAELADVEGFSQLVLQNPNDYASFKQRGWAYVRLAQFKQALPDIQRAVILSPNEAIDWSILGLLQLYHGDEAAYRETALNMRLRFPNPDPVVVGDWIAKLCAMTPRIVGDIEQLRVLVDRAVTLDSRPEYVGWYLMDEGLVEYRAGNYQAAIKALDQSAERRSTGRSGEATMSVLKAMCYHRLNRADEAKQWLSRAQEQASKIVMPDADILQDGENYLILEILRREAESLIMGKSPTTRPGPATRRAVASGVEG